jgi:hypothetical protein
VSKRKEKQAPDPARRDLRDAATGFLRFTTPDAKAFGASAGN